MKYLLLSIFLFFGGILSFAQTPAELRSWLPQIDGWQISDKVEVFSPENLWDRINGSAPLFLENNFREMTAMEYTKGDDYITIQAYRHATPQDAFGMYASERSPDMTFFPIGAEAQGDDTNIYFFAGSMYVKIWNNSSENLAGMLQDIAKGFADRIAPNAGYPAITTKFPAEDKIGHSEAYTTSSYIGHEFLKGVYTAQYDKGGNIFQAFVIDAGNEEKAREILNKYFTFTKQSQEFAPGHLLIKDRYNGNIPALWKGQYILGIFSESGNEMADAEKFLDDLSKKL